MGRGGRALLWLMLPLTLSFIMLALAPLREGDLGWHLRLGEAMVRERAIPVLDRWSVGGAGQSFNAAHSWLSDVLLYLVWRYSGLGGLVLMQALMGMATVALLLLTVRDEVAPPYAASLALLGFLILYPFSTARPQIFSFTAFALLEWLLWRWRATRALSWLRLVPLLLGVWTNLHGAWSMGALLLALTVVQMGWEALRRRRSWADVLTLTRWSALSAAATLLNPLGLGAYRYVLVMGTSPISQRYVSEWQPPTLTQRFTWPFWMALALALGLALIRWRRLNAEALPTAVFTLLALRYVRMIPFAALALIPWMARTLRAAWPGVRAFANADAHPHLTRALLALLLVSCILAVPWVRMALGVTLPLLDPYFPADAVAYLARVLPEGTGIFTLPEWGGYVIWQLYPQARPFVDGRVEVAPVAVWEDYLAIAQAQPGWVARLEHYGLRWLLLERKAHAPLLETAQAAGWRCVWGDAQARVLVHPDEPWREGGACPP